MRPVAAHNLTVRAVFWATVLLAVVFEVRLRRRTGARGRSSPEWSYFVVMLVMVACIVGATVAGYRRVAPLPGGVWWPTIAGIVLMWVGAGFRIWSVATLGRHFQLMVVIQDDHRVISRGPYRYVRHPAYLGTIVYFTGFGLIASDWVSVGLMLCGITALLIMRMQVEERALEQALGSEYSRYMQRTARLVPGLY